MSIRRTVPLVVVLFSLAASAARADRAFSGDLSGAQQVPPVATAASGLACAILDAAESQVTVFLSFAGLSSAATAAHIHEAGAGSNGPSVFDLAPPSVTAGEITPAVFALTPAQVASLKGGLLYVNVHTGSFPGGEIRAQLYPATLFLADLHGSNEVPPAAGSDGSGTAWLVLDDAQTRFAVCVEYQTLSEAVTAGHVHEAPAGSNGPVVFDLSPPSATDARFGPRTFAATGANVTALFGSNLYANIHTAAFPGGEIRGQFLGTQLPVELLGFTAE